MSEWKVLYRDDLDNDRTSRRATSKEGALSEARDLHWQQRAVIYRIEGPEGEVVPREEVMRWASAHKNVVRIGFDEPKD